ncbi:MAG: hypothetical protein AMK73_00375 [Planctomycetes bacterium SM23_32]|nr:MAG: hypothetical protein AMK73_00375 [Planctomycetes bacterium SM23_32]
MPAALAADGATVAPNDVVFYAELSGEAAEELVGMAALPPVAGLFLQAPMRTPFGGVNQMLGLPQGSLDRAAPHVESLAVIVDDRGPAVLVGFDEARWPQSLLEGIERRAGSDLAFLGGEVVGLARDEFLVLGTELACERLARGDYAPLASDAAFAEARAGAADARLWGYLSAPRLIDAILAEADDFTATDIQMFVRAAGLDRAKYATLTARRAEEAAAGELKVMFDSEDAPVVALLPEAAAEVASQVPGEAAAALLVNWGDASTFFNGILDIATDVDAAVGRGTFQDDLTQAEAGLGFTLDALFAQLGSGAAVYLPRPADRELIDRQDWVAVLLLDDAQGFEASLKRLMMNAVGQPPMPQPFEGVQMFRLFMPPAFFAVQEDRMVMGGSPQAVKACLDWQGLPERTGLEAAAGGEPLVLLFRADLGTLLSSYPTAEPGVKLVLTARRRGPEITLAAGYEDFDLESVYRAYATGYVSVMAAFLMPALGRARGEAQKAQGRANLHNIGLGLAMAENDNNGQLPDSLEDIYTLGYLDAEEMFVDPADKAPVQRGDLGLRYSYEYVGSIPGDVSPGTIICYTRRGVHPEGRSVLCRDLAVLWVTEWQLQADAGDVRTSLRASYDAVVEAFGDELTPERDAELRKFYQVEP